MSFPHAGLYGPEAVLGSTGTPATDTPVNVYLTGTTTAADLFTDQTMGSAASNPTTTDPLGNLSFYAIPGMYDLAFTVGGVATTLTIEVLPWWGDLAGDAISAVAVPGAGAYAGQPVYSIWGVATGETDGDGNLNVTIPDGGFPNGLLTVRPNEYAGPAIGGGVVVASFTVIAGSVSAAAFTATFWYMAANNNGGTEATQVTSVLSGPVEIGYEAIGY